MCEYAFRRKYAVDNTGDIAIPDEVVDLKLLLECRHERNVLQKICAERSDEIDRLRADVELLRGANMELRGENVSLRAEVEALRWRCVADEMPEHEGTYLCHFSDGVIETFPYDDEDYNGDRPGAWGASGEIVTHWMPLPEPPALRGEVE